MPEKPVIFLFKPQMLASIHYLFGVIYRNFRKFKSEKSAQKAGNFLYCQRASLLSTFYFLLSPITHHPSPITHQLSTINSQLSTLN
jgi:hypothetical protein